MIFDILSPCALRIGRVHPTIAILDSVRLFASSAARNLLLGLGPEENLVFGHTHIPFKEEVKPRIWVGNTGCWGEEVTDPSTGKPASNSYLKIYDGNMELHFFNSRSPGI